MNGAPEAYHCWYYENQVWVTTYLGVPIEKFVTDLWNYQEIITRLRPALIVEFGTKHGGSALYFAELLRALDRDGLVFTVDIVDMRRTPVRAHPLIHFCLSDSASPDVGAEIQALRAEHPGPVFAILDSDHSKAHVLAEMKLLRPILVKGDYLVVEDGNINGHPVLPNNGPGPFEAVEEYFLHYPNDYHHDNHSGGKFGFTAAPGGYLARC